MWNGIRAAETLRSLVTAQTTFMKLHLPGPTGNKFWARQTACLKQPTSALTQEYNIKKSEQLQSSQQQVQNTTL